MDSLEPTVSIQHALTSTKRRYPGDNSTTQEASHPKREGKAFTAEGAVRQVSELDQQKPIDTSEGIKKGDVVTVEIIADEATLTDCIQSKVNAACGRDDEEDPFYMVDLGELMESLELWVAALPSVKPFYAIKCNSDIALLKTLAALGIGFDCASKNEMKVLLDLGVSPDRIILSSPCKFSTHIKFAAQNGIKLMTFDNEAELYKMKDHFPTARLVLRIKADSPKALMKFGCKYGCTVQEGYGLLHTAKDLGLDVVGVSFHVGGGCETPETFQEALELSASLFQYAEEKVGYHFTLLDIGGGFPGTHNRELFEKMTSIIKKCLETHFTAYPNLEIIAEPGRFFACSTHSLAVCIVGKKMIEDPTDPTSKSFMYYVSDGIHGSFAYILFDHDIPTPFLLNDCQLLQSYPSSLWGPTCNSLDKITDAEIRLPELSVGDWLYFINMGAYTPACASYNFNGFLPAKHYYYITRGKREEFKQLLGASLVEKSDTVFRLTC